MPLSETREATGAGRDGANALSLLEAARWYGLRGRGVKLDLDGAAITSGKGAILHWSSRTLWSSSGCAKAGWRRRPGRRAALCADGAGEPLVHGRGLILEPADDFPGEAGKRRVVWGYVKQ